MKGYVAVVAAGIAVCVWVFSLSGANAIYDFLGRYSSGNMLSLLGKDALDVLEVFGEEPTSYDSYGLKSAMFTYATTEPVHGVSAVAIIWEKESGRVDEIRLGFSEGVSVEDCLALLGYSRADWEVGNSIGSSYLGDKPYRTVTFLQKKYVGPWVEFLLNHFSTTVYMLRLY